jgi:hypothetical protein
VVTYSQCNVLTGHHCVLEIIWSVISWYLSYHLSFQKNMGVLNFFLCVYIYIYISLWMLKMTEQHGYTFICLSFSCIYIIQLWLIEVFRVNHTFINIKQISTKRTITSHLNWTYYTRKKSHVTWRWKWRLAQTTPLVILKNEEIKISDKNRLTTIVCLYVEVLLHGHTTVAI